MKPSKIKTLLIWCLLLAVLLAALFLNGGRQPAPSYAFEDFLMDVENGHVSGVRIHHNEITVTPRQGPVYRTLGVLDEQLQQELSNQGAIISWGEEPRRLGTLLTVGVPVLLLLAFLIYFARKAQGGAGNILSLAKSRHRVVTGEDAQATFADVGGCEEAKAALQDVVDFLRDAGRWAAAGARLPRGVLLEGPPGCGKTLLARAVAGETQAKFFLVSASEFVEMFVGVGAARVRDMFEQAAKQSPAVIFIDELDAVGRRRGSGIGAGHDEREQTLNQLLVSLDGFANNSQVVVIGATNRPDVLDSALLRPGRFDRRIKIPPLTAATRLEILDIHTRDKSLAADVDLAAVAAQTDGFHGAQLENLSNEAALSAMRRTRDQDVAPLVSAADFDRALTPLLGEQRRFNKLDAVLIESASQLAEPTGRASVKLKLKDATTVVGDVVWADAKFIKLQPDDGAAELLIPKRQVLQLEALPTTAWAPVEDVTADLWAARVPELA